MTIRRNSTSSKGTVKVRKVKTGCKRSNVCNISEHVLTTSNSNSSAGDSAIREEGRVVESQEQHRLNSTFDGFIHCMAAMRQLYVCSGVFTVTHLSCLEGCL